MDKHAQLIDCVGEDAGRQVLVVLGQDRALRDFTRECAIRYAVSLFEKRVERLVIRDRIIARYELSRSVAYRCVDRALERFSHSRRTSGTPHAEHNDSRNESESMT